MLRDASLIPLSHQHHNGLALAVLTRRSLRADPSPANLAALARRVIDRYEVELKNHFEIEEQVLFPLLADLPLVGRLIAEHRALERLVEALLAAPAAALLDEFATLLAGHIRLEETELFEEAQRRLPRAELDRLASQIDRRAVRVCI